jgi:hypothetical protein
MHVCICMFVCMCMYVHICLFVCMYMHVFMHACMYVRTYVCYYVLKLSFALICTDCGILIALDMCENSSIQGVHQIRCFSYLKMEAEPASET